MLSPDGLANGHAAGACGAVRADAERFRTQVRASRHGRGVGRGLLDTAIDEARLLEMRRLELTSMSHNKVALCLFEACGFIGGGAPVFGRVRGRGVRR
ncbi:GNAT family N-acetyltransferase [Actinomadura sp. 9N215]|uniref:GNAT family N-acetyltransferase n=1 Tax=Actinomadura sp. 9N215 TaxID=3375150 RepID=UPI0037A181F4